jgi:hypothetical protein
MSEAQVHLDMQEKEYFEHPAVSRSDLKLWIKDPDEALAKINERREGTFVYEEVWDGGPLAFGSLFHMALLEPEKYADRTVLAPPIDRRSNKGKDEWAAFVAECEESGRIPVSAADAALIENMTQNVQRMELWQQFDNDPAFAREVTIIGELGGIECKIRADLIDMERKSLIIDIKTTQEVRDFHESAVKYGYYLQDAMYRRLSGAKKMIYLIVPKREYAQPVFAMAPRDVREKYDDLLDELLVGMKRSLKGKASSFARAGSTIFKTTDLATSYLL